MKGRGGWECGMRKGEWEIGKRERRKMPRWKRNGVRRKRRTGKRGMEGRQ
jgi:hypothetical protein